MDKAKREAEEIDAAIDAIVAQNEVQAALGELYDVYCKYGYNDGLTEEAVEKLMNAYDRWLE